MVRHRTAGGKILAFETEQESRFRLKQVLVELGRGRDVRFTFSIREALGLLEAGVRYECVLISSVIAQEQLEQFVREARQTQGGTYAAYVLLLKGNERHKGYVAQNLMQGIQGFLCEPYSVDDVREFLSVVAEASQVDIGEEKRSAAAGEFLLEEILRQLEVVVGKSHCEPAYGYKLPRLRKISESLRAAFPNVEDYTELLISRLESAVPSQLVRRRRAEEIIIDAAPAKAPDRQQFRVLKKR